MAKEEEKKEDSVLPINNLTISYGGYCAKPVFKRKNFIGVNQRIGKMDKEYQKFSNVIPKWKFIFLIIITFGFYEIIWFYRTWKFFKEKDKLNISPFWRAIFSIFFIYSLFKRILALAKKEGYKKTYSAGNLTVVFILIAFSGYLTEPLHLISYLSFLPLIPSLLAMNFYWNKKNPKLPAKTFYLWQIILIIIWIGLIGLGIFVSTVFGT